MSRTARRAGRGKTTTTAVRGSSSDDWRAARDAIVRRLEPADLLALAGIESRGPAGAPRYPCPAPQHRGQDRGPDLCLGGSAEGRAWYCQACGSAGDVFGLATFLGLCGGSWAEQLRYCAGVAGVDLPDAAPRVAAAAARRRQHMRHTAGTAVPSDSPEAREVRRRIVAAAQRRFTPDCMGAYYLDRRGISHEDAQRCGVGWISDPAALERQARQLWSEPLLRAAGMLSRRGYWLPTRHRLVIPGDDGGAAMALRDVSGTAKPKEYSCGRGAFAYRLAAFAASGAAAAGVTLLTEGTTDYLAARAAGYAAIGLPGTGSTALASRPEVLSLLQQLSPPPVPIVVCGDGDVPGQRFAAELVDLLQTLLPQPRRLVPWAAADGADVADLHRRGQLRSAIESLIAATHDHVDTDADAAIAEEITCA